MEKGRKELRRQEKKYKSMRVVRSRNARIWKYRNARQNSAHICPFRSNVHSLHLILVQLPGTTRVRPLTPPHHNQTTPTKPPIKKRIKRISKQIFKIIFQIIFPQKCPTWRSCLWMNASHPDCQTRNKNLEVRNDVQQQWAAHDSLLQNWFWYVVGAGQVTDRVTKLPNYLITKGSLAFPSVATRITGRVCMCFDNFGIWTTTSLIWQPCWLPLAVCHGHLANCSRTGRYTQNVSSHICLPKLARNTFFCFRK